MPRICSWTVCTGTAYKVTAYRVTVLIGTTSRKCEKIMPKLVVLSAQKALRVAGKVRITCRSKAMLLLLQAVVALTSQTVPKPTVEPRTARLYEEVEPG